MANTHYCNQILKEKKIGFAVFDETFALVDCNFRYSNFLDCTAINKNSANLWEMIPEFIGSEAIIRQILSGRRKNFVLENINKVDANGKLRYFNLILSRIKARVTFNLFCMVHDVTQEMSLKQELRQKDYEIKLLQSQLVNKGEFLADTLLGNSPQVKKVRKFIHQVATYNTTVLLQGESGTGKSLTARLIHRASTNPQGPFVEINCAAIPATLLESELFGYEKGAFTNALTSKKGLLEEADGGTLFLDEIGELPLSLQAKLLTFLETKRFRRLGSTKEQSVNVRLIAASNKDLKQAIADKEFREDLFYRINVVSLILPPIRELGDDVITLANHFISVLRIDLKKHVKGLTKCAERKLTAYRWPGNVRELRNVIERAMIFAGDSLIDDDDLLLNEGRTFPATPRQTIPDIPDEGLSLDDVERQYLIESLKKTRGNQSRSAQLLGMSLDTFRYRLKKFEISPHEFR